MTRTATKTGGLEFQLPSARPSCWQIMELWQKFYTVHEIANALGLTPEAVQAAKNEARRISAANRKAVSA